MRLTKSALIAVIFASVLGASLPAGAQEEREPAAAETGGTGIFRLLPKDAVTEHVLKRPGGDIAYTATAGTMDLFGQDGNRNAKLFYTAYVAKDGKPDRPITFAFNGGPGAASAYLHLGLVGPRILDFDADHKNGATPALSDNPDSWLDFTDLVLIDPVGTGWSRAATADGANGYYNVRQDAESLAKVIALYLQKNDRMAAPKYLLGESYGGFRAAKVAAALKESQSILVSGVVMVSPLIEGRFLGATAEDPLAAALLLPSLAAATLERQNGFSQEKIAEAERFAMTDYLVGLAGAAPSGEAGTAFYGRVADLSGVPRDQVAASRGFLGDLYGKAAAGPGRVVSSYDAAYSAPDAYPESSQNRNDDAILDGYTRAFGAAFSNYARHELGFETEITYSLLNTEVNRRWEWNGSRGSDGRSSAGASGDLRDLMSVIPEFRLLVAHGYSDPITPYGVSRYVIDHLPANLAQGRAMLKLYRGGHMFYTDHAARQAFSGDMKAFYERGAAD